MVIGTAAIEQPQIVDDVLTRWGAEALAVGLDSREGLIVTRGWQETTLLTALEVGMQMRERGVVHALYTEVGRDGRIG